MYFFVVVSTKFYETQVLINILLILLYEIYVLLLPYYLYYSNHRNFKCVMNNMYVRIPLIVPINISYLLIL